MTQMFLAAAVLAISNSPVAAAPARGGAQSVPSPEALPAERPLHAVIDASRGRVVVNRAQGVRIERVRGGTELKFTLVNGTRRRQAIRIGLMHLAEGDYDVYAAGPVGSGSKLDDDHLAGGWRFVLAPPQITTPFGEAVGRLTGSARRARLLPATRTEPELTKALAPLETALRQDRMVLEATCRTDVALVRSGTVFIQAPVKSTLMSEAEIDRRWRELERLQREVVAAADRSGNASLASRVRIWFTVRLARPGKGQQSSRVVAWG